MSKAIVCDQCGSVLVVNDRGESESETGEEAAWVKIVTTFAKYDLCTRACAHALLDSAEFVEAMDEGAAVIAEIAGTTSGSSE
jgi:hypothetical protein